MSDRVVTFEKVEEFAEEVYDIEDDGGIEMLFGLDQYQMDYGVRYVIHTDVREVVFASKLEPIIEQTVST